jgi:formylmethanofuran dehydrogenase subunit B
MTEIPMALEINCTTGEEIMRPLTAEEITQREIDAANAETERVERETAQQAKAELKASAKAKLVAGTPLTEEEAATIVL